MPRFKLFFQRSRLRRFAAAPALLWVMGAVLGGCTPSFDWRTVNNQDGGYSVMYPAKPALDERTVHIGGQALRMQMQSAKVGDAVFAIGVVMLPDDKPDTQAQVLDYLQRGLARNISATPQSAAARIALDADGQSVAATEFAASGVVADAKHEARFMRARFAARGARVYEAVIVAPREPAVEQVDQFFDSLKLN